MYKTLEAVISREEGSLLRLTRGLFSVLAEIACAMKARSDRAGTLMEGTAAPHKISRKRRKFIEANFFEWSFSKPDDYLPDKARFLELDHPAELHYLAGIYNWDDDTFVLRWILESPLCSRATANLLFWRSVPGNFEQSDLNDELTCPDYRADGFRLVKLVLERYQRNDFSAIDIAFDPAREITALRKSNPHWQAPLGVYDTIEGIAVKVPERAVRLGCRPRQNE